MARHNRRLKSSDVGDAAERVRFCRIAVSTQDSESCNASSNFFDFLARTLFWGCFWGTSLGAWTGCGSAGSPGSRMRLHSVRLVHRPELSHACRYVCMLGKLFAPGHLLPPSSQLGLADGCHPAPTGGSPLSFNIPNHACSFLLPPSSFNPSILLSQTLKADVAADASPRASATPLVNVLRQPRQEHTPDPRAVDVQRHHAAHQPRRRVHTEAAQQQAGGQDGSQVF